MTVVIRRTFSQADLDEFARISGGDGRIHTDPVYAAATRFGHTLTQGMLLLALMEQAIAVALPGRRSDSRLDVTFVAPVGVGQEVRITQLEHPTVHRFVASTDVGTVLTATLTMKGQP